MQYLDLSRGPVNGPKATATPESQYINELKFVLMDAEHGIIFLSTSPETSNPNHVYIGEL